MRRIARNIPAGNMPEFSLMAGRSRHHTAPLAQHLCFQTRLLYTTWLAVSSAQVSGSAQRLIISAVAMTPPRKRITRIVITTASRSDRGAGGGSLGTGFHVGRSGAGAGPAGIIFSPTSGRAGGTAGADAICPAGG